MRIVLAVLVSAFVASTVPISAQAPPGPNSPPAVIENVSAEMHLRIAIKAVDDGNYQIALEEVREAARLAPAEASIQFALATILDKTGRTEEALSALEKAQAIGVPDAYKPRVDDLMATLLYKRRKAALPATEPAAMGRATAPVPATAPYFSLGPRPPGGVFLSSFRSRPDGRFEIALTGRIRFIQFYRPGFMTTRFELSGSSVPTELEVIMAASPSGEVTTVRLPRGPSKALVGQVKDIRGAALPDVSIELYDRQ